MTTLSLALVSYQREGQAVLKILSTDQTPKVRKFILVPSKTSSKSCKKVSTMVSTQGNSETEDEKNKENTQVHKLEKIFEDFPVASKDLLSPSGPLFVSNLLSSVSNGCCLQVAYQGVHGAYSECAAKKAYPNCELVTCEQFEDALNVVEHGLVDRAVLPIENSLGGSILQNYDLLLKHSLHIVGEVELVIRHCLLANHGVRLEDLKRVLSHEQAVAQCENTLTKLGVVKESRSDTAGSAQYVFDHKLQDTGAIASSEAARIYGLNILAQDIQDDLNNNVTRFLMLSKEPICEVTDRPFKTSIDFVLEDWPGTLVNMLHIFKTRQINLTKIESRPWRKEPQRAPDANNKGSRKYFDYFFYMDFEASMADPKSQSALRRLKNLITYLRVLGSYPKDTSLM